MIGDNKILTARSGGAEQSQFQSSVRSVMIAFSHCGFHSVCRNRVTSTVVRLRPEGAKEELVTQELPWRSFFVITPVVCTFTLGQMLALYEHRTAVQSGCLGVNSKSSASLCSKREVLVSSVFDMDEMTDVIGRTSDHGSQGL